MQIPDSLLLEVAEAKHGQIRQWNRGIQLERDTALTVEALRLRVTADRWQLAREFNERGMRMLRLRPPLLRDAISRFYYSMYHSLRSVSYLSNQGDDFQEHKDLPSNLPGDFRDHEIWSNNLKNAREVRNRADYEPYPQGAAAWATDASVLRAQSAELLERARVYLAARGCAV